MFWLWSLSFCLFRTAGLRCWTPRTWKTFRQYSRFGLTIRLTPAGNFRSLYWPCVTTHRWTPYKAPLKKTGDESIDVDKYRLSVRQHAGRMIRKHEKLEYVEGYPVPRKKTRKVCKCQKSYSYWWRGRKSVFVSHLYLIISISSFIPDNNKCIREAGCIGVW